MVSTSRGRAGIDTRRAVVSLLSAVLVVALAFLLGAVVSSLAALAVVGLDIGARGSSMEYVVASAFQFVGFGLAVAGYLWYVDAWSVLHAHAPRLWDFGWAIVGIVSLLAISTAASAVLSSFGITPAQNQVITMGQQDPVVFLYMIPIALLLVGPFEELVFRGAAQGLLRRALGPTLAVAIASTLFGAVHLVALIGGNAGQLAYVGIAALLGLVLGGIYEHTRNLLVPVAIHGVYNATLFAIQWLNATGTGGLPPL